MLKLKPPGSRILSQSPCPKLTREGGSGAHEPFTMELGASTEDASSRSAVNSTVLLSEGVSCAGGRRGPGAGRSAARMCIEAAPMSAARAAANANANAANAPASGVCTATGSLGEAGPAPSARSSAFVEPGEVRGASGERVHAKRPDEVRARPSTSAGDEPGGGGAAEGPIAAAPPP